MQCYLRPPQQTRGSFGNSLVTSLVKWPAGCTSSRNPSCNGINSIRPFVHVETWRNWNTIGTSECFNRRSLSFRSPVRSRTETALQRVVYLDSNLTNFVRYVPLQFFFERFGHTRAVQFRIILMPLDVVPWLTIVVRKLLPSLQWDCISSRNNVGNLQAEISVNRHLPRPVLRTARNCMSMFSSLNGDSKTKGALDPVHGAVLPQGDLF